MTSRKGPGETAVFTSTVNAHVDKSVISSIRSRFGIDEDIYHNHLAI